jgi:hypothetical protein
LRPIPDREISPELAEAVAAFRDAMAVCRGNAIDDDPMTPKSRRQAWTVDDYAIVEALLRAGWTPPDGKH